MTDTNFIIDVQHVKTQFGTEIIHNDLNFSVSPGEIVGIVGGSGSGKTTLLRALLHLQPITAGSIYIFGKNINRVSSKELLRIQRRWGVLFQQNALFSSLNILENIAFPLKEHTSLDKNTIEELALSKILLVGLPAETAYKYPAQLSGGMQKRAGLARALALDPELLFLDEPTAGLDPDSAAHFDELILELHKSLRLTVIMVSHDLDSLWHITHRVAFLGEGRVLCIDSMKNLIGFPHPLVQNFFKGPRGRIAEGHY